VARFTALFAELEYECAIRMKDLNAVIVLVGNNDAIQLIVESDASWSVELTRSCSVAAEFAHEFTTAIEHLNSIVRSISNYYVSLSVTADAPGSTKLAVTAAFTATVYAENNFANV
jgi:hypothetical protein